MGKKHQSSAPQDHAPRITNRRAYHDYHIEEKLEVGIVLQGSEVKTIRNGQVSLGEGYAHVEAEKMELYLYDVNITQYQHATATTGHDVTRRRKLLARKKQIKNLLDQTTAKGVTLVPLAMYFVRGRVKLEIGIGRGKRDYDKRQSMKTRDARREIDHAMTRKRV